MKKWKETRKEMLPYERGFEAAGLILSVLCFIAFLCEILMTFGVIPIAFNAFLIARGLLVLVGVCAAVSYWRKQRFLAITYIVTAILFLLGIVLKLIW